MKIAMEKNQAVMKITKRRAPKHLIKALKEARSAANFERMGGMKITLGGKSYGASDEVTEAIKEALRLYRQTWVMPQMDKVIAWMEGR